MGSWLDLAGPRYRQCCCAINYKPLLHLAAGCTLKKIDSSVRLCLPRDKEEAERENPTVLYSTVRYRGNRAFRNSDSIQNSYVILSDYEMYLNGA